MNYPLSTLVSKLMCHVDSDTLQGKYIHSFAVDTRSISDAEHTLFVCLKGTKSDGHNYIRQAIDMGVRAFLVRKVPVDLVTDTIAFVVVDDPLYAMQQLARFHRSQFSVPVVGITGSNGKTQVKEWISQILFGQCNLVKSPRSFNSQIGVPLSVQMLDVSHDIGLFEAGISEPDEMARLQQVIAPTIGVLTHMGDAHLSNFNDRVDLLEEKLLLFQHVDKLIYFDSQEWVKDVVEKKITDRSRRLIISQHQKNADVFVSLVDIGDMSTAIVLRFEGKDYSFTIPYKDEAAIENAILSASFVLSMGLWCDECVNKLAHLERVSLRLEIKEGLQNATIIDDSYNSDLLSLSVALNYQEQNNKENKEKVLVLSDLSQQREEDEAQIYHEVASLISQHHIVQLYGVGSRLYHYRSLFEQLNAKFYLNTDQLIQDIPNLRIAQHCILIKGTRSYRLEEFSYQIQEKTHQTYLEVNLDAMRDNLQYYKSLLGATTKVMAMVKASSYGTGSIEVAHMLQNCGVDYLAVAIADEGIELRKSNVRIPVVVMNPEKHAFDLMLEYDLEPNIYDFSLLNDFAMAVSKSGKSHVAIHVKLDTGMRRLGFDSMDQMDILAAKLKTYPYLKVKSVFTHLAVSDTEGEEHFTYKQFDHFEMLASHLEERLGYDFMKHTLNTAGIERFAPYQMDMVRLGIGLYGVSFFCQDALTEVMTLKTQISQLKVIDNKDTVGYGRHGRRDTVGKIAILPIGYADGYHRKMGNGNHTVLIRGVLAPTIGNICMDMCMVDVTNVADVSVGDEVIVFGPSHSIHTIAESLETIPYEVMTGIGQRVKKIYFSEI
ncbi:bifunctional UDP-N-acetylmuramoyl-tripeptide:D-alanyl-D-alanine ligase/alanine racemase [Halosquirtibacter xylanolyticus]|uniref:bifunctional UDP-N-acetylmuramoyl-tripeptide:D-alanyl-D-alanine ligase/alanine racemase n=1 Tax=Halosquirtibacter xylanolyticus TaxID=3374599 RepID=UPI003749B7AD|nr:bifunctional UDP-N-acetylmuramoyl-tripeptide:D-alanyl-D-alanine ligase/alanine racemase [Prolixibacteraceae bacterium]